MEGLLQNHLIYISNLLRMQYINVIIYIYIYISIGYIVLEVYNGSIMIVKGWVIYQPIWNCVCCMITS